MSVCQLNISRIVYDVGMQLCKGGIPGILLYAWVLIPQLYGSHRSGDEYSNIDGTAVAQLFVIAIATVYVFLYYMKYKALVLDIIKNTPLFWFVAYSIFSIFSSLWSDNPLYSYATAHTSLIFFILCIIISLRFADDRDGFISWAIWWAIIVGCMEFFIKREKDWSDLEAWHGFAIYYITPIFLLTCLNLNRFKWHFSFLFILIIISTSVKVYIGIVISFLVYILLTKRKNLKLFMLMFLMTLVLLILIAKISLTDVLAIFYIGRDSRVMETASGRTVFYPIYWEMICESPFLGYGFSMGEKVAYQQTGVYLSSTHNVFLSACLYSGVTGLFLILAFWIDMFKVVLKKSHSYEGMILFLSLVLSFVFTLFDQGLGNKIMCSWISQAILSCYVGFWHYKNIKKVA